MALGIAAVTFSGLALWQISVIIASPENPRGYFVYTVLAFVVAAFFVGTLHGLESHIGDWVALVGGIYLLTYCGLAFVVFKRGLKKAFG